MRKKVLFADLDDTIIETRSGSKFAKGPWDWKLKPGVLEAIAGYNPDMIHIVSNQGGIARGLVKEKDWLSKIGRVIEALKGGLPGNPGPGITFDYCKSLIKDDPRRKPNPGMITDFMESLWDEEEPPKCLMIGDASGLPGNFSNSDWEAAKNAGIPYLDVNAFINLYKK